MAGRYGDKAGWLKKKKAGKPWTTEFCVVRGDVFEIYPDDDIGERRSERARQTGRRQAGRERYASYLLPMWLLMPPVWPTWLLLSPSGSRLLPMVYLGPRARMEAWAQVAAT
eukprot:COSAG02_NODE_2055_length_9982_cov_3.771426_8_plen_112_part_00